MKLKIAFNKSENTWNKFLFEAYNPNIFSHTYFDRVSCLNHKIYRYFIYNEDDLYASFKISLNKKKILTDGDLIFSPINYKNFKNFNSVRIKNTKHEILKSYINFIFENHKKGNFTFDNNTKDIRAINYFNFEKKKKIFLVDEIRYSSIINLDTFNKEINNIDNSIFFKNCDERTRRQIRKIMVNLHEYDLNLELNIEMYKNIILETFKRQKLSINYNLDKHIQLVKDLVNSGLAFMFQIYKNKKLSSILVHTLINENSLYLNGGRLNNDSNDLSFTYGLIASMYFLKKKNAKFFDLEGINSPKRGQFKLGFGGKITSYYKIKF